VVEQVRNSLAARRASAGWTQADLARVVGVSRQTIISIERERFDPSLPLAFSLAEAFACRIDELFHPKPADDPVETAARLVSARSPAETRQPADGDESAQATGRRRA
jgi:putative transcriptional regulator